MAQFWTRKNNNYAKDKRTANPWYQPLEPQFKNIFFDLGGVLFNLNTKAAFRRFAEFGMPVPKEILDDEGPLNGGRSENPVLDLIHRHDIGEINGDDFLNLIQSQCRAEVTREQILDAYNGMIEVPTSRLELLKQLHKDYRVFLLSNIGDIHWQAAQQLIKDKGYQLDELFHHCFCSYQMKVAKPDAEIFERVIRESGVNPSESLYIDDSPANIKAGTDAGFISYLIAPNTLEQHIPVLFEDAFSTLL